MEMKDAQSKDEEREIPCTLDGYLIIVDDIWHYGEWKTIKMSLPDNNLGSRIVTTSRVIAIAEKWYYDLDAFVWRIDYPLNYPFDDDGVKKMMRPDMVGKGFDHGHPIVDMCTGVPLAVLCMSLAVAKERERQEQQGLCVVRTRDVQDRVQELVNRNGIQNTPGFEAWVESLELGYNDLPHHMLKTCLLYCSIYPEDHCFVRWESNNLVRRWIAEGFVCEEEAAEHYYDELFSRGFWKYIPKIFQGSWSSRYEYQMHPMMRNYLRWKLREENFITCTSYGVPSSPICRLCIDYWPSSVAADPLAGIDWHHIRSLVVFEDAEKVPYKHLEHLRVLDGAFNNQHLKDICGLLRLRHLFVPGPPGGEQITEMPADIVRLQYLETLDLRSTRITRLPSEIGGLKQLKVLDVSYCRLTELPRELENLQHLETARFKHTTITEQAWEIIGTLKKLRTLDVDRNFRLSGVPRNIGELQQLKNLYMNWSSITELPKEIGKLQQLKNLDVSNTWIRFLPKEIGQLHNLETLNVSVTGITELPKEIGNLGRLEALDLSNVRTITRLPREIGQLQHLERLHLLGTSVRKIPREIGGLKKLKILDTATGTLPFEAGQIPKLKELPECVQRAWKNSDLVSSLSGEILSFHKVGWGSGDGGLVMGTKHMHIPQWIKEHFNNIFSLDIRICKLEERDLEILREMPYLWKLTLRFEGVPRKPIAISSEGFVQLTILYIDSRVPRITFQEGAMPKLGRLEFEFQFYGGPPNTEPPMGIKHLVNLIEVRFLCNEAYRGDSPCITAAIDAVTKEAWEHPQEWFEVTLSVGGQERVVFRKTKIVHNPEDTNEASSSGANETQEIQD